MLLCIFFLTSWVVYVDNLVNVVVIISCLKHSELKTSLLRQKLCMIESNYSSGKKYIMGWFHNHNNDRQLLIVLILHLHSFTIYTITKWSSITNYAISESTRLKLQNNVLYYISLKDTVTGYSYH